MGWLSWLAAPSEAEVRAEVWSLGVRHHGEPLDGALKELREPRLTPARAALLRMCVQQLRKR
jgi:hypothetical protein